MQRNIMVNLGLAVVVAVLSGCGQTKSQNVETTATEHDETAAKTTTAVASAPSAAAPSVRDVSVREVATSPSAHLGHLTFSGVVGIVTPKKGFVLIDMREYQGEGFGCLTNDEPTKISVRWPGLAPKVKDAVRVDGELTKEKNGYAFTANKVGKA